MRRPRPSPLWLFAAVVAALGGSSVACEFGRAWQRSDGPVLRSPIPGEAYEVAGDPHAFRTPQGAWRMIYSADDQDQISIRLALGESRDDWREGPILLGPSKGHDHPRSKETAFYRLSRSGEHQIYFIGYDDETTYRSEVHLAVADELEGPYEILPEPVVPRGEIAGRDVYLITSPSVVEHEGRLFMTFLGWDGLEDVTEVWVLGAVSLDDGRSWTDFQEVGVPIGMEGQVTKTPEGRYAAVRTGAYGPVEAIFIACSEHPFGPYVAQEEPILVAAGRPWEVDEIIAPAVAYDPASGAPILFYAGADHGRGWWILSATPSPQEE